MENRDLGKNSRNGPTFSSATQITDWLLATTGTLAYRCPYLTAWPTALRKREMSDGDDLDRRFAGQAAAALVRGTGWLVLIWLRLKLMG
jgi:hypothetical protein